MSLVPRPPSAPVGPPRTARPTSAREHFALVQQVKASLAEAKEQPPAGVNIQAVTHRRRLLESVLRDLEKEGYRDNTERQDRVDERRAEAERQGDERAARLVDEASHKQATHYISHLLFKKEISDVRAERAQVHHNKAFGCKVHHARIMCDRIDSLERHAAQRYQRLEALKQSRQENIRAQHRQRHALAKAAEEKRLNQIDRDEDAFVQNTKAADEARLSRDRRAASARATRLEKIRNLQEIQETRRMNGPDTKTSVFFTGGGGPPVLCTTTHDHSARMRLADEASQKSLELYQADTELRDALKIAIRRKAAVRTQRAMSNYDRILDEKLQRFEELKNAERLKTIHVVEQKMAEEYSARKQGRAKAMAVASHRKVADALRKESEDKLARDNMRRWNQRTASVVDDIVHKYQRAQSAKHLKYEYCREDAHAEAL